MTGSPELRLDESQVVKGPPSAGALLAGASKLKKSRPQSDESSQDVGGPPSAAALLAGASKLRKRSTVEDVSSVESKPFESKVVSGPPSAAALLAGASKLKKSRPKSDESSDDVGGPPSAAALLAGASKLRKSGTVDVATAVESANVASDEVSSVGGPPSAAALLAGASKLKKRAHRSQDAIGPSYDDTRVEPSVEIVLDRSSPPLHIDPTLEKYYRMLKMVRMVGSSLILLFACSFFGPSSK